MSIPSVLLSSQLVLVCGLAKEVMINQIDNICNKYGRCLSLSFMIFLELNKVILEKLKTFFVFFCEKKCHKACTNGKINRRNNSGLLKVILFRRFIFFYFGKLDEFL